RGVDGALWFVEIAAGQVGRITPDGRIDEFPLTHLAAWVNAELMKNVAEIGQLRLLRAAA
ncbi:hypothetical protein ACWEOR_27810, partial [Micromonospora chalcea]